MVVHLDFYKPEYRTALEAFSLPDDQNRFTPLPSEMVKRAQGDNTRHPVVILADGDVVGFFVLRSGEVVADFSENPRAVLLVALCVSQDHQGKGYAGKGLQLLKDFVIEHFSGCDEVVLAVNEDNVGALHVYRKAGFLDTGKRLVGRLGENLVFSLSLE